MDASEITAFDLVARNYDSQVHRGLSLSGERKEYFADRRIAWTGQLIGSLAPGRFWPPRTVIDYGCGTGTALPRLLEHFSPERVLGLDISAASLEVARQANRHQARIELSTIKERPPATYPPAELVYTSGVFHHIPPPERPAALADIRARLQPGGLLAFWEHNPWNPGTQLIVHRIPFDRDAVLLSAVTARRLLRAHGFEPIATQYLFVFPRALAALRPLESSLARLPLGAQYLVLARRRI